MVVQVRKSDGVSEGFDESKLRSSLHRAGADTEGVNDIVGAVTRELYDGISTSEIYRRAFAHLRDHRQGVAARYSLKRAVLDFGPSGFPFEAYMAELFRAEGYEASIDRIVQGACVEHEVDVVFKKGNQVTYVEAKFHNTAGFKTDLKTTLYVKARMDDIRKAHEHDARGLIITNTKFTSKAVQYASCAGLDLLGWEYPQKGNLHDRIDAAQLYPITALTTLTQREKMALIKDKKVLCTGLVTDTDALARAGIHGKRASIVLAEVGALCVPGNDI